MSARVFAVLPVLLTLSLATGLASQKTGAPETFTANIQAAGAQGGAAAATIQVDIRRYTPEADRTAVEAALKLPIRVVEPYKGTSEIKLSAESGELDGGCWAWESMKTMWPQALQTGDVKVILMVMPKKHPELPNVPLAIDYAKTEDARRILKYAVHDIATITRIYFVPPATPKDRVEVLRKAFADTLKDPEFLADAKKSKLDIEPVAGAELQKLVQDLYKIDASTLARLKEVLLPK